MVLSAPENSPAAWALICCTCCGLKVVIRLPFPGWRRLGCGYGYCPAKNNLSTGNWLESLFSRSSVEDVGQNVDG